MSNLKTLKDIRKWIDDCAPPCECGGDSDSWVIHLQDSAREWINWWEHCKENIGYTEEIEACYDSQIAAFKHFFNLEEEE